MTQRPLMVPAIVLALAGPALAQQPKTPVGIWPLVTQ